MTRTERFEYLPILARIAELLRTGKRSDDLKAAILTKEVPARLIAPFIEASNKVHRLKEIYK